MESQPSESLSPTGYGILERIKNSRSLFPILIESCAPSSSARERYNPLYARVAEAPIGLVPRVLSHRNIAQITKPIISLVPINVVYGFRPNTIDPKPSNPVPLKSSAINAQLKVTTSSPGKAGFIKGVAGIPSVGPVFGGKVVNRPMPPKEAARVGLVVDALTYEGMCEIRVLSHCVLSHVRVRARSSVPSALWPTTLTSHRYPRNHVVFFGMKGAS